MGAVVTISRRAILLGGATLLIGCARGEPPRFLTYAGPEVTGVLVYKGAREMYLLNGNEILESYPFELGFAPDGHKRVEGDGRTPEGQYWIDRRNPQSNFHLSLGISYPNARDRAAAAALGLPPGGEIFIHGTPSNVIGMVDWTVGCIAVTNSEMEQIYAMVKNGTPIWIYP